MTISAQPQTQSAAVLEVNEQNFQREVIERSRDVPVVVDFWAPWCGPCRTLGPTLEKLAREAKGAWVLAKVNVDENPYLAQAFRVQGIPAVKAVRDGKLVDEFTGALPESQVRTWLKHIAPAEADQLLAHAAELETTAPQEAAARYRLVLGNDPQNEAALFGLGRLQLLQGESEGAALLAEVPEGSPLYARAQALLGLSDFFAGATDADEATLRERVASNAADLEARYQLAALAGRQGDYGTALEQLLAIVYRDRSFHDDAARRAMLALFTALGDENPLTGEYRRKLANALF